MPDFPHGIVTFLFTDIVGSTGLWETQGHVMPTAYARHDAILRSAIAAHGGVVYKVVGDAFQAAFPSAPAAASATLAAQRELAATAWPLPAPLRIRTVLHTCEVTPEGGDYRSPQLNRLGRLLAVDNGGQILLSSATAAAVRDALPAGATLRDLGERRLRDLARGDRIYQLLHPDLPDDFPPLKTLDYRPHNLPVQATPFVGRERELAAVRERLGRDDVRLLTLTGPGGIGKTRLALQAAADVLERFADGVFFVPLDAITDPDLVLPAVAHALGLQEAGDQPLARALGEHLRGRELLLVLDNFEQVVDAAPLLGGVLTEARRLKLLVTSRQRLRLRWEHEFAVAPLGLPEAGWSQTRIEELVRTEAVRLFVDRARAAKADFALTAENAEAVVGICHALDGLPLAIELAAARIKLLPPRALLARLDDRLKLLTGGGRDRPARQQTLRGAISWSHDLLNPEERELFARLSVFAGSGSLAAIEAVANPDGDLDVLAGLSSLVDQSLIRQEEEADGEPRFAMLATIRAFAEERLAALDPAAVQAVHTAHAAHYLALAQQAAPALTGPSQALWLDRLEIDRDNLRVALGWLHAHGETAHGLRLATVLYRFWVARGYLSEGRRWLDRFLVSREGIPLSERNAALRAAGGLAFFQGDLTQATDRHEEALAIARGLGDVRGIADVLNSLANVARERNDLEHAAARYEESLALLRSFGDTEGVASVLNNIGTTARYRGDLARADALHRESLALKRELGDARGIAYTLTCLGQVAYEGGDLPAATALTEESLALQRELGDRYGIAHSLTVLAPVAGAAGDWVRADALADECLTLYRDLGDTWGIAAGLRQLGDVRRARGDAARAAKQYVESLKLYRAIAYWVGVAGCLEALAEVTAHREDPWSAARVGGMAVALRASLGTPIPPVERAGFDRAMAAVRTALGPVRFAAAWEAGAALDLDYAIALTTRVR